MRRGEHEVEDWLPGGLGLKRPAAPAPASHAEADRATVDLNAVDFEGLIALGISVGQAARFISQRERRGGISAVTDLDGYYGLAPYVRDILRWNGYAGD